MDLVGVVLCGGTGQRLGGIDKGALELDGQTLLSRTLAALSAASPVAVVGPETETARPVLFTREDPALGGPAAGLLAGLDVLLRQPGVRPQWLALLAVDMPLVTTDTFVRLLTAAASHDGAFLHDTDGRRQLCGVIAVGRLDEMRPRLPDGSTDGAAHGLPLGRLLDPLDLVAVTGEGQEFRDIDTWQDLRDLS